MSPSSKTASRALPTACRINLTQRRQDAKETHVLSEFGGKAVHLVGLRRSRVRHRNSVFSEQQSGIERGCAHWPGDVLLWLPSDSRQQTAFHKTERRRFSCTVCEKGNLLGCGQQRAQSEDLLFRWVQQSRFFGRT